jgi:hypothetical protein
VSGRRAQVACLVNFCSRPHRPHGRTVPAGCPRASSEVDDRGHAGEYRPVEAPPSGPGDSPVVEEVAAEVVRLKTPWPDGRPSGDHGHPGRRAGSPGPAGGSGSGCACRARPAQIPRPLGPSYRATVDSCTVGDSPPLQFASARPGSGGCEKVPAANCSDSRRRRRPGALAAPTPVHLGSDRPPTDRCDRRAEFPPCAEANPVPVELVWATGWGSAVFRTWEAGRRLPGPRHLVSPVWGGEEGEGYPGLSPAPRHQRAGGGAHPRPGQRRG